MKHFCVDVEASKTTEPLTITRNTVKRYYHLFRLAIYAHQTEQQKAFRGKVELDESYLGKRRPRKGEPKGKRGRGTQNSLCLVFLSVMVAFILK